MKGRKRNAFCVTRRFWKDKELVMRSERDILYENGDFFVTRFWFTGKHETRETFEVYCNGVTAAERCAFIDYAGGEGLRRAIQECDRRANADNKIQTSE